MREELEQNRAEEESGLNGSSLADSIKTAENAPKEPVTVKSVLRWLKKWWMIPVYIIIAVLLIIFIAGGDDDDLYKAHFKAEDMVTVGDHDYHLLTKDQKGHYIGSYVSDKLMAIKNRKVATMRSYILYVSVFYSVTGDEDMNYLMDGKNAVYVKEELYEEAKAYYENDDNISYYKMTDRDKDMKSMTDIENEKVFELQDILAEYETKSERGEETGEVSFTDALIAENYATRREIYGYFDNGLFCRAKLELFRDKEENLYITTKMIDSKDNKDGGVTLLKGIKLNDELRDYFWEVWG